MWRDEPSSKVAINFPSVRDSVQGEKVVRMVKPEKNPIVPNAQLVDALQVWRGISNRFCAKLWMSSKKVDFLHNAARHRTVELLKVPLEVGSEFDSIRGLFGRLTISHGIMTEIYRAG